MKKMAEHPIEGLMTTAMNSIKDMIDVDTIIGEPIETTNNVVIIPISKVTFGFAAGGSEFNGETLDEYSKRDKEESIQYRLPFGGGSAAGVNINPIAFLVVQSNNVKVLPVSHSSTVDKLLDYIPDLMEKGNNIINKYMQNMKEDKNREVQEKKRQESKFDNIKTVERKSNNNSKNDYEFEYNEIKNNSKDINHEFEDY